MAGRGAGGDGGVRAAESALRPRRLAGRVPDAALDGWGTPEQLLDVEYQVNKFYDVLLTVPGWEQMRPGDAAQAVERSALPERYHQFEQAARQVLGAVQGIECTAARERSAVCSTPR